MLFTNLQIKSEDTIVLCNMYDKSCFLILKTIFLNRKYIAIIRNSINGL